MKFTYSRNPQTSSPTPIALLASSYSQLPISERIRQIRNSSCKDLNLEGTGLDTQDETNFCSSDLPDWVPSYKTHRGPAVKVATSDRGSDRLSGEMSARGRGSEETTGQEATDAEFWVPKWARLGAAASEEQRGGQQVAAAEQDARATGTMRGDWRWPMPIKNSTSTENDEDPLQLLWGPAVTQATREIPTRKVQPGTLLAGTNPWSADNTFFGAYAPHRPRLNFAPLPTDHIAGAHGVGITRQWTPDTDDGPILRLHPSAPTPHQPPTFASRLNGWCEPGGTHRLVSRVSEKMRNWLHIRKFALQSRIGERRIWLTERFDRKKSARVREREQSVRVEEPLVNVTVEEFTDDWFAQRDPQMAEDLERVLEGEVFGFELCRTR